jgi:hypothetical protein
MRGAAPLVDDRLEGGCRDGARCGSGGARRLAALVFAALVPLLFPFERLGMDPPERAPRLAGGGLLHRGAGGPLRVEAALISGARRDRHPRRGGGRRIVGRPWRWRGSAARALPAPRPGATSRTWTIAFGAALVLGCYFALWGRSADGRPATTTKRLNGGPNEMAEIRKVAVVGAGTMGNGIVHVFAQNGYDVTMIDVREDALEKALATIGGNMDRQIRRARSSEEDKSTPRWGASAPPPTSPRWPTPTWWWRPPPRTATSSSASSRRSTRHAPPRAILASNTSSISITEIAGAPAARSG